jgi:hypothetical protein
MGFIGSMIKVGIAKRVYDEARKPHNQAKMRSAFHRVTGKSGGGTGRASGRPPRR